MTAPMTWVGFNVHACSTHAAAIDGETHRSCGPGPRISVATGPARALYTLGRRDT